VTPYCIAHGGGVRCQRVGCSREVVVMENFCSKHLKLVDSGREDSIGPAICKPCTSSRRKPCTRSSRKRLTPSYVLTSSASSAPSLSVLSVPDLRPAKKVRRRSRPLSAAHSMADSSSTDEYCAFTSSNDDVGAISQLLISDEILLANDALLALEFWGQYEDISGADTRRHQESSRFPPDQHYLSGSISPGKRSIAHNHNCRVMSVSLDEGDAVADLEAIRQAWAADGMS
jgi:hypothetical protein